MVHLMSVSYLTGGFQRTPFLVRDLDHCSITGHAVKRGAAGDSARNMPLAQACAHAKHAGYKNDLMYHLVSGQSLKAVYQTLQVIF